MPGFVATTTQYTVVEYCGKFDRKELVVNRDYQRHDNVWPTPARSFLVESILLGYPIPKLSIWEITDLATRSTLYEIVDGQQRTKAIVDYYHNRFAVSERSEIVEARGKRFDDLPGELKAAFIKFRLSADIFTGATPEEIRELFRRINSYTVSLNAEEQRHARCQGPMKWFIYELCRLVDPTLLRLDVFGEKQLARMQDAKFIAEIVHATIYGIQTTKARQLDKLYTDFDKAFPQREDLERRMLEALVAIQGIAELDGTEIAKPHNFYALYLAVMHAQNSVEALEVIRRSTGRLRSLEEIARRLMAISAILEADDAPDEFRDLWKAASEKTNTADTRSVRFCAMFDAVSAE